MSPARAQSMKWWNSDIGVTATHVSVVGVDVCLGGVLCMSDEFVLLHRACVCGRPRAFPYCVDVAYACRQQCLHS